MNLEMEYASFTFSFSTQCETNFLILEYFAQSISKQYCALASLRRLTDVEGMVVELRHSKSQ